MKQARFADGGLSWVAAKQVNWEGQFSFINPQTGWAVARNEDEIALVATDDGDLNWRILNQSQNRFYRGIYDHVTKNLRFQRHGRTHL